MPEPRIIAIETSGRSGSVAIAEGPRLIQEAEFAADQEHARDLLPLIDSLFQIHEWTPASVEQCHVSIGPGSFTGLRVAVTFARHFALATGAKICAVPTLDVIAMNALRIQPPPMQLAVILDAKRNQVFGSVFRLEGNSYRSLKGPVTIEPAELLKACGSSVAVLGEGVPYHMHALRDAGVTLLDSEVWRPRAARVHHLGWQLAQAGRFTPSNELVPFYVRRPEAEELWEKRHGSS